MADLDRALADCLDRMQEHEASIEECLRRYPKHRAALSTMLRVRQELIQNAPVEALPRLARARGLGRVQAHLAANPRRAAVQLRALRLALASFTALAVFLSAGTWAAQAASPGDRLYSWKLASERVGRELAPDRAGIDVFLLERRIEELLSTSGSPARQVIARQAFAATLADLRRYGGTVHADAIRAALIAAQSELLAAGLDASAIARLLEGPLGASEGEFQESESDLATPAPGEVVPLPTFVFPFP